MRTLFLLALLSALIFDLPATAFEAKPRSWLTRLDGSEKMAPGPKDLLTPRECSSRTKEKSRLTLTPSAIQQTVTGFGAALTESAAILLGKMEPPQRRKTLEELFKAPGARLNLVRIPIGATDFSTGNYSCADLAPDNNSRDVARLFDLDKCMGNILPVLKELQKIQPELKIIATPWSPPAWMKSNQALNGGELLPKYYADYARYLVLFLKNMATQGIAVDYLTVLNEPLFTEETKVTYPWANMKAEEQAKFIGSFLGPELEKENSLKKVRILAYDHNWDHWEFPALVLANSKARQYIAGTAFHCYRGEPDKAARIKGEAPQLEIHMTECTSGKWSPKFEGSYEWGLNQLLIQHFRAGSQSLVYWNMLLDSEGGPKNGGCTDCRGILNLTPDAKQVERSPEFYVLHQASSVITPGAVRIKSGFEPASKPALPEIAFKNPDGSLAWIASNNTSEALSFELDSPRGCFSVKLPARSAVSAQW
jgi:glucosylceramidase